MAKIVFGQGVAVMRGKLGGSIFSQNKGGNYIKNYNTPTNPQTAKQLAVRSLFSSISTAYSSLTSGQKDSWKSWAETLPWINNVGEEFYLSGKGLFQKANLPLRNVGIAMLSECPDDFESPSAIQGFSIVVGATSQDIVVTSDDSTVPANTTFVVDGAVMNNGARANNNSLFKRITSIAASAAFDTADLGSVYAAVFGAFSIGQTIELRAQAVNNLNGMVSPYLKASTVVVTGT